MSRLPSAVRVERIVNDAFRELLKDAMLRTFGVKIESHFSIFAGTLISQRVDGKAFSEAERAYINAYERGYFDALDILRENME